MHRAQAQFPRGPTPAEAAVAPTAGAGIAGDIRTRYTIGYVPVRSGEKGSLRKIKVAASQPGGRKLITHSRTSYFLPDIRPGAQSGKADKKSVL